MSFAFSPLLSNFQMSQVNLGVCWFGFFVDFFFFWSGSLHPIALGFPRQQLPQKSAQLHDLLPSLNDCSINDWGRGEREGLS